MPSLELCYDQDWFAEKLRSCAESRDLSQGRRIHAQIIASGQPTNRFLANLAIDMYGKCGSLGDARANGHLVLAEKLFHQMPKKNQVSWNALISAYAELGEVSKARHLFEAMPDKNVVSWTAMLAAFAERGHLDEARDFFVRIPNKNVVSWTTMILAYVKNDRLSEAREMFDRMPLKNVVTWTTMIGAYGRSSHSKQALRLFQLMDLDGIQPNAVTLIALADACAASPTPSLAKLVDSIVQDTPHRSDLMVVTALVNLHGRSGCVDEARGLFDRISCRDLVLWTAIITAYAHNGLRDQALELFQEMELQGLEPNEITYINVLAGAAYAGLVEDACSFFASMVGDYSIAPLLDHYIGMAHVLGRAGRLAQAQELIESMPFIADYVAWMTLLSACETHLDAERGILAAEKASELNPETSSPYVVLANIHAATGDEKLARALEARRRRATSVKTDNG
ncbi:pentatricopeptide repeat-containing protein At4g16835, mitochondrial-like [Selaginella moellendorffii]|uniref:pentatricopeptide repeat-containing protein At4g16835, mitochondrial-like n=1 Tax=Selaginella moellendorffii TaxID=88036 RepID=UPI000D1CCE39|nr:pentatricopeptide repeat-containing protein At4g16835, mitochondrial-like [Selaginella moellendorffii]|eukprot:XP_024518946.1 pentatricopeptide repeat-containing protein At4g16835, mitochondrial-like [Selaginella moellendorffii]